MSKKSVKNNRKAEKNTPMKEITKSMEKVQIKEEEQKRLLTDIEIEDILTIIKPSAAIPKEIAQGIADKNRQSLKLQLEQIQIYPTLIPQLKDNMKMSYYKTLIQPGESVGVATAQSIGERQTQMTLNTFHSAGSAIKTVITGVPRFSELLNATKEPKTRSTQIFFTKRTDSISSLRNLVSNKIRDLKLRDLISAYSIFSNKEKECWYETFEVMYPNVDFSNFTEGITFHFNKEMLLEYKLSLSDVAKALTEKISDIKCVFSPNHIAKMDVYVDMSEIELVDDMTAEECYEYHLREHSIPSIKDIQICGIQGVTNIFFEKKEAEWMLDTEGSNFKEILGLEMVDKVRTVSNDMWEIYNTLGIEAARNFLVEEFNSVVSSDGTYVNLSHILLLVDVMTFNGTITAISRYGHKKENCGPMAKASFEESLENFLMAGISGEKESTKGVSASIMLGKVPRVGTGLCDVLVDIKNLPGCPKVLTEVVEK